MNVRDLKLSVATGIETDEIKSLNVFFDNLFSDLSVFIDVDDDETDLIFMKGDDFIMKFELYNQFWLLCCGYFHIWKFLIVQYKCSNVEVYEIVAYKILEIFNIEIKFGGLVDMVGDNIEKKFKNGLLTPASINMIKVI